MAAGRIRLSVGLKLTLATTLLVSGIVAGFALMSVRALDELGNADAARQREIGQELVNGLTRALVKHIALATRTAVAESNYGVLKDLAASTTREFGDIAFVQILNQDGQSLADTRPGAPERDDRPDFAAQVSRAGPSDIVTLDLAGAERLRLFGARLVSAQGEGLGQLRLGYSTARLEGRLQRSLQASLDQARATTRHMLALALGFLVVGGGLALFQSRSISVPLRRLSEQAGRISAGDLSSRVEVRGSDELGALSSDFNHMAERIVQLLDEARSKVAIEKELEVARVIQETLVPRTATVRAGSLQLASHYQPASVCGGDWWTYQMRADGTTMVVIGDVTGHGVPAAIITAAAAGCISTIDMVSQTLLGPDAILAALNRAIYLAGARHELVMTCHVAIVDPVQGELRFANAGHTFPYRVQAGGKISVLARGGFRLGDSLESTFEVVRCPLDPRDLLIWYTDGLVECTNAEEEAWGEHRLRQTVRSFRPRGEADPDLLRGHILASRSGFICDHAPDDDVTMVVGCFLPPHDAFALRRTSLEQGRRGAG